MGKNTMPPKGKFPVGGVLFSAKKSLPYRQTVGKGESKV
jgi:hypothetical protein